MVARHPSVSWLRQQQTQEVAMIERRSIEDALAELEEIMRGYKRGVFSPSAPDALARDEAVNRLVKLHFTVSELCECFGFIISSRNKYLPSQREF